MIAILLPNSFPIVIATSSAAGIIHRLSCGLLVALSHILKNAKLNWFHLAEGKTPKEVAEILEVTKRSVDRWQAEGKKPKKKKTGCLPGRPSKLSGRQMKRLEKALDKGAYAFGYTGDYWTLDRIAQVIWQQFGVRYETSAVWYVMRRMGWSNQRPQRRPLHRNEETIEQWKQEELPRIKKVSPVGRYPRSGR